MRALKTFTLCALSLACVIALICCSESPIDSPESSSEIPPTAMQIAQEHAMPFAPVAGDISKFTPSNNIYDPPYDNYDLYSVTLIWGDLSLAPIPTTPPLDWSGEASINGVSTIDVVYQIDFEAGEDSLLSPNSQSAAAWVSQAGDLDGLGMLIYLDTDITYITAPWLSLNTEQIDLTLQFYELENFARVYQVSGSQALVVVARKIWSSTCPAGSMIGEWIRDDISGKTGTLAGTWFETANVPAGLFSGQFEMNNSGIGSLTGSVSGYVTDEVIYQFKGSWQFDDPRLCPLCGSGHGRYQGVYSDMNGNITGIMKGEFGYASDVNDNRLPLQGIWRQFCPPATVTDVAE